MARVTKKGITFYRMDSGHIRNEKVRLLCNEFDSDGYYIWSCLVDYGYLQYGYYFDCNDKDKLELFASEYCRKKLSLVKEVIAGCLRRGLFSKAVYELSGVLTCEMMQDVFMYGTYDRRKKGSVFELVKEWVLSDFEGHSLVGISIVPLKNIDSSRDVSTDETKTKTETKTNTVAEASPPPPVVKKVSRKKTEDPPEPHWQKLMDVWFNFNLEKFKKKNPGVPVEEGKFQFVKDDPKILKRLIILLRKRAEAANVEWTEAAATTRFFNFLTRADGDKWLGENFLLSNLEKQYNRIIQNSVNGSTKKLGNSEARVAAAKSW